MPRDRYKVRNDNTLFLCSECARGVVFSKEKKEGYCQQCGTEGDTKAYIVKLEESGDKQLKDY